MVECFFEWAYLGYLEWFSSISGLILDVLNIFSWFSKVVKMGFLWFFLRYS